MCSDPGPTWPRGSPTLLDAISFMVFVSWKVLMFSFRATGLETLQSPVCTDLLGLLPGLPLLPAAEHVIRMGRCLCDWTLDNAAGQPPRKLRLFTISLAWSWIK